MKLTEAQVQQFKTDGYLAIPDFWDARETAAIQAEIERLKRDGLLYNIATDGDGKSESQTRVNLQLCPMHEKSDFVRAMPIELPAGGVLFFAYGVAHCTGGNNTDKERAGLALHFLRGDDSSDQAKQSELGQRPYLIGKFADGGVAADGAMVGGTWDAEVEKALAGSEAAGA